jgi:CDP-glycerol glycerophosphotransferase (TagB/SpsB family)
LTWHGVPIKKIGYDAMLSTNKFIYNFKKNLVPYMVQKHDLYIACGREDAKRYVTAFGANKEQIKICGYARNDRLIQNNQSSDETQKIDVIYMPTLRGHAYSEFNLLSDKYVDLKLIDALLSDKNIKLHIKPHPVNIIPNREKNIIDNCKNIVLYHSNIDIYDKLSSFDALVTDLSGVMIDFLLTNKPIINFIPDFDDYRKNDRDLYFEIKDFSSGYYCKTWGEMVQILLKIKVNTIKVTEKQQLLKQKYHVFSDAGASERSWQFILNS